MRLFIFMTVATFSSFVFAEFNVSKISGAPTYAGISFDGEKARQIFFGLDDKMESVKPDGSILRFNADKGVHCSYHRESYTCLVVLTGVQYLDPNQAKAAAVEAKFEKAD